MKKPIAHMDFKAGEVLLFNKPKTWSSFNVVAKVRYLTKEKKVGHAGTLDPLATGLLILCTGKKTKEIQFIQDAEKEYVVEFCLGATTPSYDAEFPPENIQDASHISKEILLAAMDTFKGEISQVPPIFSAVKVDGKRAYKAAREGKEIELKARLVTIRAFELLDFPSTDKVSARIVCTKGTYIRSLVHDLGQKLGVGAYMTELVRTRIGEFSLENAFEIPDFEAQIKSLRNASAEAGQ